MYFKQIFVDKIIIMIKEPVFYQQNDEEEEDYKQELGLKKMLYKYEHENEQLKAQIKALTERLADIMAKKEDQPTKDEPHLQPSDEYRLNLLKQEMKRLYGQIEKITAEIKNNKELVNEFQELKCIELQNQIKKQDKEIDGYKEKMQKYDKMQQMKGFALQSMDLKNSSLRISTHEDKRKWLEAQLQNTRKSIRQLEKYRDEHDRVQIKRQHYVVTLNKNTRKLQSLGKEVVKEQDESKDKKSIWHMDFNQQNYNKIKAQLTQLRKEKDRIIQSLKNQNIVLQRRFAELSVETEELNKSIHLPNIEIPRNNAQKYPPKQITDRNFLQLKPVDNSRVNSPPRLLNVGPKQFERSNDKNYSPKKMRKIQWQSSQNRTTGIEWNDAHLRSPITGINFWFDGHLIGLQLIHKMGESTQHLHLITKTLSPIQYRLNGNDYVENVALWISENRIVGIQLISKNGRNDGFGIKGKGRKFDYLIKDPEKPVFSYGKFRITNNVSEIIKLGFQVI